ncbi:MAG: translation initiation factor IF-2 [Patescibacteria group bacterium]
MNTQNTHITERAPVVAIMGHIDHGKSTLLAYIRKSTKPLNEAGGITQSVSAYEVEHITTDNIKKLITFIDTPGHEAFSGIRQRGARVADIAILVVSAEDGVKPQTIEAFKSIRDSKTPFIVAINKIDKPGADIDRTKQSLAENEIYVEGYGGDIPFVPISAKTGDGVPELLTMILLVAELEALTGDRSLPGSGIVIESNRDIKKGISATCIIKNGTVEKGMYIASGSASTPVRIMENFQGVHLLSATFSSPIKLIGWDILPEVGESFQAFKTREEAVAFVEKQKEKRTDTHNSNSNGAQSNFSITSTHKIPVIVKADTGGSLEAVLHEIQKLGTERISAQVIGSGIGTISESDIRLADGHTKALVIGFNIKIDAPAKSLADRNEIKINTFDIIYKLTDWLREALVENTPKMKVEESTGVAKILKIFSKVKDKQILGGRVESGSIMQGAEVRIMRRDAEIGVGKVRELQQQKSKTTEVLEGKEFGAMIESKVEIAPGDHIQSFIIIEK